MIDDQWSLFDGIFGSQLTPSERIKEWTSKLKSETRTIDREIRNIERDELKVKQAIKTAAKKNEKSSAITLAKGLIQTRRTKDKMMTAKANINSLILDMKHQVAIIKVSGCMEKSAQVMKYMSQIVNVPQIANVMRTMQQEMLKSGLISEMMDDAFESIEDPSVEEEANAEVDAVLYDITLGQLGSVAPIRNTNKKVEVEEEEDKEDEDIVAMRARFSKLNA